MAHTSCTIIRRGSVENERIAHKGRRRRVKRVRGESSPFLLYFLVIPLVLLSDNLYRHGAEAFLPSRHPGRSEETHLQAPRHRLFKNPLSSTTLINLQSDDSDRLHNNHKSTTSNNTMPKHVAFICDGNSRWARKRHLPTLAGHVVGADRLVDLLEDLGDDGIEYCTLYGFSTENWSRPANEIQDIFRVMEQTAWTMSRQVLDERSTMRIRLIGDLQDERIPVELRSILEELQQASEKKKLQQEADGTANPLTVCLAVNYGGRQDILQASRKMAVAIASGELSADEVTEETLASFLSTAGIPDPDMIVRTSGEYRLSNFLLWNCAYSELYMTPVLWPDFDQACWRDALHWYQQRQRRFGSRSKEPTDITTSSKYKNNEAPKKNGTASM
jgi:undecaprenyl diphosphate synthase